MTKSQQIVLNGKHCYDVGIANGKTEEEALAFARSMAVGHGGPMPHSFTDAELKAGVCRCQQCKAER